MAQDRKCGFCKGIAPQTRDTERHKLFECRDCGSDYLISKGNSWWYHGWEHPDGRRLIPEMDGYSKGTRPERLAAHWRREMADAPPAA